ncbi:lipoprotein insertase outer membrane protein LolB [Nitrosomonas aestuarii]|uniref:lipoprotein insertase outer membrane protein LolB n=1 Tax=Nitrosomonas aestuarii TaxID=52441 RepID=UPI000D2FF87A|nr:lipoprotein insertase outer membrane protein LolB [Nitrosomonas aestuarii]PTN12849.1 outer membrane lipoprotein LolB [Nitrosomonas aestuarii]
MGDFFSTFAYCRYLANGTGWQLLLLFLPLLISCATLTPQTTTVKTVFYEPAADLQNAVAADFELLGRVSVRNENQRFSGNVHWMHTTLEDTILLLSPLGQAVAEINKNEVGVHLVTSKQEVFHAHDVEDLTAEILGWRLPLSGLQYWIQGQHSPLSAASVDMDSEDRIVTIRQDGWQIFFTRYYTDLFGQSVIRPRIIELQFKELSIRMVIDNWTEVKRPSDTLKMMTSFGFI